MLPGVFYGRMHDRQAASARFRAKHLILLQAVTKCDLRLAGGQPRVQEDQKDSLRPLFLLRQS